jgi:hypothetical protein
MGSSRGSGGTRRSGMAFVGLALLVGVALPSPAAAARSYDMDRDGLGNAFEQSATLTNPRLGDTDRDGVSDGAEDPDADGLANLAEQAAGSHPRVADTDGDGLGDATDPDPTHAPAPVIPGAEGCTVFPVSNVWNRRVDTLPVRSDSSTLIGSIGRDKTFHMDFGSFEGYGIPYQVVDSETPRRAVTFDYDDESDPGPYPIPPDAPVENGGDRHVLALRQGDCKLFELYAAERAGSGWRAYSGAAWDLKSNALRPERWTSADAAGLPILPGLARREEADAGAITHALRITVPTTQKAYIHPATHWASSNTDPDQPPMGLRVRLKASYDISRLRGQARVVAQALKTYGALVADNAGSARVYISGSVDTGWVDDDLNGLKTIPASALEAVRTNPVVRGY